jgi:hypothetical protein
MVDSKRFILHKLAFTGPGVRTKELTFNDGLNLIWGASNAGKSFTLKALDFMTGARSPLPNITERKEYDRCWLELDLQEAGRVTLADWRRCRASRRLRRAGYGCQARSHAGGSPRDEKP